jgi:hypothetical protein
MRRRIPDVLPSHVVAVTSEEYILGSADGYMETKLGWLDEQGRLIDDDMAFMVDGRGRGRGDDYGLRSAPNVYSETEINGRGKCVGYGEGGGNRQTE